MRRIVVLELLCITALAAMIFAGCGGDGGGREMARPDNIETELAPIETAAADQARVIIGFKQPPGRAERQMVEGHGGNVAHVYTLIPAIAAKIPEQAVEGIRHNPNVAYVEGDPELRACQDELGWGADRINAETLWGSTEDAVDIQGRNDLSPYTGEGCVVAILDTGIDYTHPDLDDNYRSDLGSDYVNDDADPMDDNGHGTHCAGVVAAEDNELGMINVAPRASLVALKVLDANGVGYTSDVVAALDAAAQQSWGTGFRVCSMSFSGEHSGSLKKACGAAYNSGRGILLVAAAGDDAGAVGYPAAYDSVIAVSATVVSRGFCTFG
ncbi:MAG: S8 family serine peptidase [Armatimonadota bacterium]